MFKRDYKGSLMYVSENGRNYYLYRGYTDNMLSSDITYIHCYVDNREEMIPKCIGFVYGDLKEQDTLDYIEDTIKKFEKEEV